MKVLIVSGRLPTETHPGTMTFVKSQAESLRPLGVDVRYCEITGPKRVKYARGIARVRRMVEVEQPDVVHAHHGFSGMAARCQRRVPVVISYMGDELLREVDFEGRPTAGSGIAYRLHRLTARMADAVIVKSKEMAERVGRTDARVIPNGVDFERFRPMERAEARRRLGLDPARAYVLFPANPATPYKGFALARAAIDALNANRADAVELIALEDVPPSRVPLLMNAADVVLMTSYWEGSPNVIKEAMACGRPIVSTAVGDVREVIGRTAGCQLVPRDARAVAAAVAAELAAARERTSGREDIAHLEIGRVARRVVAVYEDVLRRRNGA